MTWNPLEWVDARVHRHRTALTVVAVATLALGAFWTHQVVSEVETTREVRVDDPYAERGWFTYEAPVEQSAAGFEAGEVLGMGEPGYFSTVAPRPRFQFHWSLTEPEDVAVTVEASLSLLVRAHGPSGREYWTLEEPLNATAGEFTSGETLFLDGVLDFEAMAGPISEAVRAHGGKDAERTWTLVATVDYEADLPFGLRAESKSYTLPVDYNAPLYVLPADGSLVFPQEHGTPEVTIHQARAGGKALRANPLPPLAAFAGIIGLALSRRGRVHELEALLRSGESADVALRRHENWLTCVEGPLPPPDEGKILEEHASLPALHRMAARVERKVVYDRARRAFFLHTPDHGFWFGLGPAPRLRTRLAPPLTPRPGSGLALHPAHPVRTSAAKLSHRHKGA